MSQKIIHIAPNIDHSTLKNGKLRSFFYTHSYFLKSIIEYSIQRYFPTINHRLLFLLKISIPSSTISTFFLRMSLNVLQTPHLSNKSQGNRNVRIRNRIDRISLHSSFFLTRRDGRRTIPLPHIT